MHGGNNAGLGGGSVFCIYQKARNGKIGKMITRVKGKAKAKVA